MINLSPLEDFVKKYLKGIKKSGNTREILPFVLKAIALIKKKLGVDCCNNPATTYSYTNQENDFTHTVRALIKKMHGPGTDKILNKVIEILEKFVGSCCNIPIVIDFVNPSNTNLTIKFVGQTGRPGYTETRNTPGNTNIELYPGKYVISLTVATLTGGSATLTNSTGTIINIPDLTAGPITQSTAALDLHSPYTVTITPGV